MIDFMANIKNKKNITKCNMKTLMATSALCVFFNGALIYGMDNHTPENVNNNTNEQPEGQPTKHVKVVKIENFNNVQEPKNNNDLDNFNNNETTIHKLFKEEYTNPYKKLKKEKNNSNNIFFNYKDHFSLFFCCNLCNDRAQNRKKYLYKRRRKHKESYANESSQREDEISIISFKKVNAQGEEKPNEEESNEEGPNEEGPNEEKPNADVNGDMDMPKVIK